MTNIIKAKEMTESIIADVVNETIPSNEQMKTVRILRKVVQESLLEAHQSGREDTVKDLLDLLGKLPVRQPLPKHLLAIDLHNYARLNNITL